jgi:hypothetical protein
MILREDVLSRRLAASGFCLSVLLSLCGALALMVLTTAPAGSTFPAMADIALKYSSPKLTAAMRSSMYDYVTDDEDIGKTEAWIAEGRSETTYKEVVQPFLENDCVKCHSKSSTMSDAAPHMPMTTYAEVLIYTERGKSWRHLAATVHTHLFGIGLLLLATSWLFSYAGLRPGVTAGLISVGFLGLWLDVGGWVLAKFTASAALPIFVGGGMTAASLGAMAGLTLVAIWFRVPLLSER